MKSRLTASASDPNYFGADPDPAFYPNADPDPGSVSETQIKILRNIVILKKFDIKKVAEC